MVMNKKIIEKNDRVNFDFEGFIDNKPFKHGSANGFTLIVGSNQFISGFEEKMIGLVQGQEAEIDVTFPKDYE